jgi:hypothetical protein
MSRPDRHAPLAGQTVTVYTRRHGTAAFARAATLVTGPGGTARYGFRPAASTDVVARFAAPPGWQAAATRPLTVLVHPALSATLSPRAIRLGQQATLTGSLSPARAGQVVYRQGFYGGAWHTWATARVSPTGRFSFTIRPTVRTTDRYRVYLPADAARAATASPTLTLAVG